jgi:hypothetical protein
MDIFFIFIDADPDPADFGTPGRIRIENNLSRPAIRPF